MLLYLEMADSPGNFECSERASHHASRDADVSTARDYGGNITFIEIEGRLDIAERYTTASIELSHQGLQYS
jgi:hypothetical protein